MGYPTTSSARSAALTVTIVFALTASLGNAQEGTPAPAAPTNTVRAEVAKPIQASLDLLKAKKYKDALTKIHDAEAALMILPGRTPFESYMVQRVKGQVASASGDAAVAAEAFEAAIASPAIPTNEKIILLSALAGQYYMAKNYAKSGDAANRYFKEGGSDKAIRTLQIQASYLGGDLAQAGRALQAEVTAEEQSGNVPSEQHLQMLADIANRQKDSLGFMSSMEKLVSHYPKRDYWLSLVYSVASKPNLPPRLHMDIFRVKLASGTMRSSDEYVEAAQLAIQAGFPAEAKKFIDAGYESGMLGTGAEADRHKRLRDSATKSLADDTKSLGQDDAKAATAATGDALFSTGLNYVFRGQADKGLPMMEQAVKKGGFKRPDDAKLQLGMAQALGGHKTKAVETLRSVRGIDGTAELARLWILIAQRS